jgi:rhodanese-related sulfurtransferase
MIVRVKYKTFVIMTLFSFFCGSLALASNLENYTAELRAQFADVPTISTAELAALHEAPLLLDVREEKEYAVSHLPGAYRAASDAVAQLHQLGITTQSPIVLYCSVGYRSSLLARKLKEAGFTNVRNLNGSIFAWANEGRPLVNAYGVSTGVHPFSILWGRYLHQSLWQWNPTIPSKP